MINRIHKILRQERDTYYNYSTEKLQSTLPMWVSQTLLAVVLSLGFKTMSEDFLTAILTVYSILTGFGFSVLFNLVSARKVSASADNTLLETAGKLKKVNKLKEELFYNITYFSVSGLILVMIVLWLILLSDWNLSLFNGIQLNVDISEKLTELAEYVVKVFKFGFRVLFLTILLNNLWSFFRIIHRLDFYFTERLKLTDTSK